MRWKINSDIDFNSFDYFEKTLITDNGFREYDVRWLLGKEINPNGFVVLGKAYGTMLINSYGENTTVVGHDFRSYSQDLSRSLITGLLSTGIKVIDIGLALTPTVYLAQHHFKCKGGAMVTASHNENGWCGLKLANGLSSTLGPDGITEFKKIVMSGEFVTGNGSYETFDGMDDIFMEEAVGSSRLSNPIKVVLAAGNGTAGRFAPDILRKTGCELIELDCSPDWEFSNHNPNPEDISFLHGISKTVLENGADLGIGIDGDGDRIGVVDDKGREVFSDKLGLLLARWICPSHKGRKFVVDVKSTGLFAEDPVLKEAGSETVMWKTGHSYIKAKVAEINAIAGFEKSGHWFFNEPYGRGYDDAIVSSVQVLKMLDDLNVPLSQLIDELPKTWQSPTIGVYCPDDTKYGVVDEVTAMYEKDMEAGVEIAGKKITVLVTVNGVRFIFDDQSFGLVRASSNKPSLVTVVEARESEDQLYEVMEHIQNRLKTTGKTGDLDQQMPSRTSG